MRIPEITQYRKALLLRCCPHFCKTENAQLGCGGGSKKDFWVQKWVQNEIPPAGGRRYLEAPVNLLPLVYSRDPTPGRFTLYPTETMWTFILLDQTDGRTWQVQWSLDGKEGISPVP